MNWNNVLAACVIVQGLFLFALGYEMKKAATYVTELKLHCTVPAGDSGASKRIRTFDGRV